MKHRIRDTIIFLFDLLGISAVYRYFQKKKGPLVRVLCFHDVPDKKWFEEVIEMLCSEYNVISPKKFHQNQFDSEKINILLTFDDGYQSWIDHCLPVLAKYQLKALFFINSGLLDIAEDEQKASVFMQKQLLISPKKPLTWVGARTLVGAGHTVGGHTVTHPNLALLSKSGIRQEVEEDKKRIEQELDIVLIDFAYPFGTKKHFTQQIYTTGEDSGYRYQYSAISRFARNMQLERVVPRTLIECNQPISKIRSWIHGGYDIFRLVKS